MHSLNVVTAVPWNSDAFTYCCMNFCPLTSMHFLSVVQTAVTCTVLCSYTIEKLDCLKQ